MTTPVISNFRIRLTDEWLPLAPELLERLGWQDGDMVEAEVVSTGTTEACIVITRPANQTQPAKPGINRSKVVRS